MTTFNPFETLGLPTRPDLDDEQVRAAWRAIAKATHPDREDGGDPAWYAQASAAYAQLNSPWGRSEAYADQIDAQNGGTIPLPFLIHDPPPTRGTYRPLRLLPVRIIHGRPLRLVLRAAVAALLCLLVLWLIPGSPAAPADVAMLIVFFALTARSDLAPPPRS
jgi:hypothetical protein